MSVLIAGAINVTISDGPTALRGRAERTAAAGRRRRLPCLYLVFTKLSLNREIKAVHSDAIIAPCSLEPASLFYAPSKNRSVYCTA